MLGIDRGNLEEIIFESSQGCSTINIGAKAKLADKKGEGSFQGVSFNLYTKKYEESSHAGFQTLLRKHVPENIRSLFGSKIGTKYLQEEIKKT